MVVVDVPVLGGLRSPLPQVVDQLELDDLLLQEELQRAAELLGRQREARPHVVVAQVLVADHGVDQQNVFVLVERSGHRTDESLCVDGLIRHGSCVEVVRVPAQDTYTTKTTSRPHKTQLGMIEGRRPEEAGRTAAAAGSVGVAWGGRRYRDGPRSETMEGGRCRGVEVQTSAKSCSSSPSSPKPT